MSESPIPEPDTPAVQPVPVADQRAAGVPPEETVTVAEQRAGADPPPQVQQDAAPPAEDEPAAEEEPAPDNAESLRGLFSERLQEILTGILDRLDKAGL